MSQAGQGYCCQTVENVKDSNIEYQIRLCSPHSGLNMVVIAPIQSATQNDRSMWISPLKMIEIANRTVSAFKLNPGQVIWIEYAPVQADFASSTDFHLIHFDWQAGQATYSWRLPIHEGWYLSWLRVELNFSESNSSQLKTFV